MVEGGTKKTIKASGCAEVETPVSIQTPKLSKIKLGWYLDWRLQEIQVASGLGSDTYDAYGQVDGVSDQIEILKLNSQFSFIWYQCHYSSVDKYWAVELEVPGSKSRLGRFFFS